MFEPIAFLISNFNQKAMIKKRVFEPKFDLIKTYPQSYPQNMSDHCGTPNPLSEYKNYLYNFKLFNCYSSSYIYKLLIFIIKIYRFIIVQILINSYAGVINTRF
ncbi:hypothetical protein B0180_01990 [Moraxella canis]|uniref:Uncharacterized protein n=1 Tax=Moraxella canis TaxID=90239 RepID=A0A1S9ZQF8_9GAMM|nr:hypothetical protein B0180_01990 [Moraxella canis]